MCKPCARFPRVRELLDCSTHSLERTLLLSMAGGQEEGSGSEEGGEETRVGLAVATTVRVKIPEGGSFPLEGGFSLKAGDELLGLVRRVTSRGGSARAYDVHTFGLEASVTPDGTALRKRLLRSLALSGHLPLVNVPKSWVDAAEVDRLTERFDAAVARTAGMEALVALNRPAAVAEGQALLTRMGESPMHPPLGQGSGERHSSQGRGARGGKSNTPNSRRFSEGVSGGGEDDSGGEEGGKPFTSPLAIKRSHAAALGDEFSAVTTVVDRETHLQGLDPLSGVADEILAVLRRHLPQRFHAQVLRGLGLERGAPLPSVRGFQVK